MNGVVLTVALAAAGATVAAAFGLLPFLTFPLQFGEVVFPHGGILIQSGVVVLLLAIVACLPAANRVLALERAHRDFSLCMSDVADAYRACHAADRAGVFTLSSEYDSVKERITFLRNHPDLGHLEPDILEVAAEMSQASRDLAQTYSDENVNRARAFLQHRQEEIDLFDGRVERARALAVELRAHHDALATDEAKMEPRLAELEREHGKTLEALGFTRRPRNVVPIGPKHAVE